MNLSWIPPDHREAERIEADPVGYAEFQMREAIRSLIAAHGGKRKAEFRMIALFDDEAGRLVV